MAERPDTPPAPSITECLDDSGESDTAENRPHQDSSSRVPQPHPGVQPSGENSRSGDISRKNEKSGARPREYRLVVSLAPPCSHRSNHERSNSAVVRAKPITPPLPPEEPPVSRNQMQNSPEQIGTVREGAISPSESNLPIIMVVSNKDACNQPIGNLGEPIRKITFSWEKLEPGQTGHIEDWSIDLAAKALATSGTLSTELLSRPSEETLRMISKMKCRSLEQNDADDFRDEGYIFTRGNQRIVRRLEVTDMGPSVNNIIRADRVLKRDVYGQRKNLDSKLFPKWMQDVDPITVFRRVFLDTQVKTHLCTHSNKKLESIDCNKWPIVRDCEGLTNREVDLYFMINFLIVGCYYNLMDDRSKPLDDFYYRYLMPRDRMLQIAHIIRLKEQGQTSEQYLSWLSTFTNNRLRLLHRRLPKVLAVQTYSIGFSRAAQEAERRPTRPLHVTVLRAGYVLFRMQYHYLPEDMQISGFRPSPGVGVLQRLFSGIQLNGRYVLMAGETTIETAEFFLRNNARFIGSTGPLPATARDLDIGGVQRGVIGPAFPYGTFHFEPAPGLRECILMKRYRLVGKQRTENVFLKMPRNIITDPHVFCTIGGGSVVPVKLVEHDSKLYDTYIPLNCFLMMRINAVNKSYERNYECFMRFGNCCMTWHQNAMFHALFSGFISCWMSHAASRGVVVSHYHATRYLFKQLLEVSRIRLEERRRFVTCHRLSHELKLMRHMLMINLHTAKNGAGTESSGDADGTRTVQHAKSQQDQAANEDRNSAGASTSTEPPARKCRHTPFSLLAERCHVHGVIRTSDPNSEAKERAKVITKRIQKDFKRTFLVIPSDGRLEKIGDESEKDNCIPPKKNMEDLLKLQPEIAEKAIRNVHAMEERVLQLRSSPKCEWIRKGFTMPEGAFKGVGEEDPDSSDHDSDPEVTT